MIKIGFKALVESCETIENLQEITHKVREINVESKSTEKKNKIRIIHSLVLSKSLNRKV